MIVPIVCLTVDVVCVVWMICYVFELGKKFKNWFSV